MIGFLIYQSPMQKWMMKNSKIGYVSIFFIISGVPSCLVSDPIVKETRNWMKYV